MTLICEEGNVWFWGFVFLFYFKGTILCFLYLCFHLDFTLLVSFIIMGLTTTTYSFFFFFFTLYSHIPLKKKRTGGAVTWASG